MWDHQAHFRIAAQTAGEGVFSLLDPNLQPNVLMIGILVDDRTGPRPLCFEPDDCVYDRGLLSDVKAQAQAMEGLDDAGEPMGPLDETANDHGPRLRLGVLRKVLQEALQGQDKDRGVVTFCSWPVIVRDYVVFCALQLKKRGRTVETITLCWLRKSEDARAEAKRERERSRIGRSARRKAKVEVIV